MTWVKSRCGRKLVRGRYEISVLNGHYRAVLNPEYTPGTNLGMYNGGRVALGTHKTLDEAKAACAEHAMRRAA